MRCHSQFLHRARKEKSTVNMRQLSYAYRRHDQYSTSISLRCKHILLWNTCAAVLLSAPISSCEKTRGGFRVPILFLHYPQTQSYVTHSVMLSLVLFLHSFGFTAMIKQLQLIVFLLVRYTLAKTISMLFVLCLSIESILSTERFECSRHCVEDSTCYVWWRCASTCSCASECMW